MNTAELVVDINLKKNQALTGFEPMIFTIPVQSSNN